MLLGTLEYMSPEQASGRTMDHRTDQFSLGLILHEMVTGRRSLPPRHPGAGAGGGDRAGSGAVGTAASRRPPALEALVLRCLQKDRERRFAKTDEIAAELAALAGRSRAGSLAEPVRVASAAPSAVSVEVMPARAALPATPALYHVEGKRGVRSYGEGELAALIRRGKLTGVELVRRDDEEQWQPLFESRVYRREVPSLHDPRDTARLRALQAVGGHFAGFFITGIVMYSTMGHFPFWMSIWGAVLLMQAFGAVPGALTLLRKHRAGEALPGGPPLAAHEARPLPSPGAAGGVMSVVAQEAARVRALIEARGGSDAPRQIAEVDGILKLTAELAARQADLEEQMSDGERAALAGAIAVAQGQLERADSAQDRRLFERQLEVLQGRAEAIVKAGRVLERLRVRRDVAEHQLKQLRLDLSRGAASGLDVPELSSRLQFIRDEVDAREEVAEIGAERR